MLSKLESKIPAKIKYNWAVREVKDKLARKPSKEKFSAFMLYLIQAKKMTRYNLGVNRSRHEKYCFVTGTRDQIGQQNGTRSPRIILPCQVFHEDPAADQTKCLNNMRSCLASSKLPHKD